MTTLPQLNGQENIQAEIQILFVDNIWIFLFLPSLIYALKDYQLQEKYFGGILLHDSLFQIHLANIIQ